MGPGKRDTVVWCRVTQHARIFHGLTDCQRIPGFWGVTKTLLNYALHLGYVWFMESRREHMRERQKFEGTNKGKGIGRIEK